MNDYVEEAEAEGTEVRTAEDTPVPGTAAEDTLAVGIPAADTLAVGNLAADNLAVDNLYPFRTPPADNLYIHKFKKITISDSIPRIPQFPPPAPKKKIANPSHKIIRHIDSIDRHAEKV